MNKIFSDVMQMPDWDEINRRKRKEINLGMAKNGAVQVLKDTQNVHWLKLYKETVRLLFSFNEELDKEILEKKIGNKNLTKELEALP